MKPINNLFFLFVLFLFTGCGPKVPSEYKDLAKAPSIYPDYRDVTIPSNIAPLCFVIHEQGDEYVTRFSWKGGELLYDGEDVTPSVEDWHKMLSEVKGSDCTVDVFVRREGQWEKYHSFTIHVAEEPIDEYLSYRLTAPSYVTYEELTINQRNLTNFDEKEIYNNMLLSDTKDGQCINCHSYQNYSTKNMQFHARQGYGGALLVVDGKPYKVDLKTDSTLSAGVYPAWHPTQKVIAYSVNKTGQSFHTKNLQKVEVQDSESDLILYDIETNTVQKIAADTTEMEIFPWWSPDGKTLYYCSAKYYVKDKSAGDRALMDDYQNIHYDLYRMPYDMKTKTFGPKELLFDAAALRKSATFPRISPDGKYMLFTLGDYGCFHIWHKSSDLYLMDLATRKVRKLENVNSNDVESYHSWSSNGRWMVFSSRRDDGSYTRPYIAYFSKDGKASKPFVLPQKDPSFYLDFYRSYNIPEFMKEPVLNTPQEFAKALKGDARKATFKSVKQEKE